MGRGLLHLTVKSAEGLPKHSPFGKQHCYVEVHFGKYTARTKTSKDGGPSPVWNETLFFQLSTEQDISFLVMVERRLIKDLEIGRASLKTDTVSAQGYENAVLPLALAGKQKGSLTVVLDLKSMGSASVHSGGSGTGSSTVSYSPLGSIGGAPSIPAVHSGSSFTASQGPLKVTNLPIMLLQQPTLALYARQQLLQQQMQQQIQQQAGASGDASRDAGDAALQQQGSLQFNQQQQHGLRAPQSSPAPSGASAGARPAVSVAAAAWAPTRTAADLFPGGRGGLASSSSEPAGAAGVMFGALDSSVREEEVSVFDVAAAVDGARLDALMRAVYPSQFGGGAGASSSTSAAGQGAPSAAPQPSSAPASDGLGGFGGFAGLVAAEAALLSSSGSAVASGPAHGRGHASAAAASDAPDPFSSAALEAYAAAAAAAAFPAAAAAAAVAATHEPSNPFEAASLQAAVAAASAPSPLSSAAAAAAAPSRPASRLGSASGSSTDPSGSKGSRSTRSTEQLEELLEARDEQLQALTSQLQEKERQLRQLQEQLARLQGS